MLFFIQSGTTADVIETAAMFVVLMSLLIPASGDICLLVYCSSKSEIAQPFSFTSRPSNPSIVLCSRRLAISFLLLKCYFINRFVPLTAGLNNCPLLYSCRLHEHVRVQGVYTSFCHPTYSLKCTRFSLGRYDKFKLRPLRPDGAAVSSLLKLNNTWRVQWNLVRKMQNAPEITTTIVLDDHPSRGLV